MKTWMNFSFKPFPRGRAAWVISLGDPDGRHFNVSFWRKRPKWEDD